MTALPAPPGEPDGGAQGMSLTSLLLRAGHLLELRLDHALAVHALTARQYRALGFIAQNASVTRVHIAAALGVSAQAAGGLGNRLCAAGLVRRIEGGPGLPVSYVATSSGRKRVIVCSDVVREVEHKTLRGLPAGSIDTLVAAARHIVAGTGDDVPERQRDLARARSRRNRRPVRVAAERPTPVPR